MQWSSVNKDAGSLINTASDDAFTSDVQISASKRKQHNAETTARLAADSHAVVVCQQGHQQLDVSTGGSLRMTGVLSHTTFNCTISIDFTAAI